MANHAFQNGSLPGADASVVVFAKALKAGKAKGKLPGVSAVPLSA